MTTKDTSMRRMSRTTTEDMGKPTVPQVNGRRNDVKHVRSSMEDVGGSRCNKDPTPLLINGLCYQNEASASW